MQMKKERQNTKYFYTPTPVKFINKNYAWYLNKTHNDLQCVNWPYDSERKPTPRDKKQETPIKNL